MLSFLFSMASESLKRVQDKLFRGDSLYTQSKTPISKPAEPGLTIDIPKPAVSPKPPPKVSKPADAPPRSSDEPAKSYRARLMEMLGAEYCGVEKYRLMQDGKKERHWKRWGPYLSDRQWVRAFY
jgi:hypothetical protein